MKLKDLKPLISGDVIIHILGIHEKFENSYLVDYSCVATKEEKKLIKYSIDNLTEDYLNAEVVDLSGYDDGLTIVIDLNKELQKQREKET